MKKLVILLLLIVSLLNVFSTSMAKEIEVPLDIKIGLYYNKSAKNSFTLSSPGGIEIGVMRNGKFSSLNATDNDEEIVVKKSEVPGAVYVEGYGNIGNTDEYPYFASIKKDGISIIEIDGNKYRGNIEVRRFSDSDMTVINHLSMQEYLYGVVPREIGGNSEYEAVKAQAIVARTYAAKNYNKRISLGFNLFPTTDDQAYGGYKWENPNSNRAVDETFGKVVVYDGELIGGVYFSTSGGYTESSENVWGGKVDYLKAVPDTYEPQIEGNTSWEVTMSAAEIKSKLANNKIYIGEVIDLVPTEHSETGRVTKLKIIGTDGEKEITKSNVRSVLGLKSQWYSINSDAPTVISGTPNDVSSSKEEIKSEASDTEWFLREEIVEEKKEEEKEIPISMISVGSNYINDASKYEIKENDEELIEVNKENEGENIIIKEERPLFDKLISFLSIDFKSLLTKPHIVTNEQKYNSASSKNTFTFRGRGWGHAVGMSQNGAKGMAKEGFSAEEIIKWYYSGVEIN